MAELLHGRCSLVSALALVWMHLSIRAMEKGVYGAELKKLPELPEMQEIHEPKHVGALGPHLIEDWGPEDKDFWQSAGRKLARRNLLISIPSLLLSFAVWMVWSVVVAKLPAIGFTYTTDQLFWLAALPGLWARRCASSTRSWSRSSAAGCGPR